MNFSTKNVLRFLTMSFVAFFAAYVSGPVLAQSPGDIQVHISTEVAVPGHLLTPGDYVFRRYSDNPSVYEILSNVDDAVIGFFNVIPAARTTPGETEVDLSAPDEAGVRLIQTWYGPGDLNGYQFVYSNKDIRQVDAIARAGATGSSLNQP
jgi:hypothetical protein